MDRAGRGGYYGREAIALLRERGRRALPFVRCHHFIYNIVALLRERGRRALRLAEGFPDWNALGFPVEAGPAGRRGSKAD
jgi:hypothetical protein